MLQPDTHPPALQTSPDEHADPLTHAPVALHVCGVFPEHCFTAGVHTPEQTPAPEQT
jgi:hypothetical protein